VIVEKKFFLKKEIRNFIKKELIFTLLPSVSPILKGLKKKLNVKEEKILKCKISKKEQRCLLCLFFCKKFINKIFFFLKTYLERSINTN
jgi:hypothetical protein